MEHKWYVHAQILLALPEPLERLNEIEEGVERVLVPHEVKAREKVRKFLLEREAVVQVPLELGDRNAAHRCVDDLRADELVRTALGGERGLDFGEDPVEDLQPDAVWDVLLAVVAAEVPVDASQCL